MSESGVNKVITIVRVIFVGAMYATKVGYCTIHVAEYPTHPATRVSHVAGWVGYSADLTLAYFGSLCSAALAKTDKKIWGPP